MKTLLIMCAGIAAGRFLSSSSKIKIINEKFALFCTLILIFSMGVMLGQRENFFADLASLGIASFMFFLIPTLLSILFVYLLTKYFMEKKEDSKK